MKGRYFSRTLLLATAVMAVPSLSSFAERRRQPQQSQEKHEEKQSDQPVELKADLVQLRAVVTDRTGKVIDNLSKDDFQVMENGVPQQVSFFSIERVGGGPGSAAPGSVETPSATPPSRAAASAGRVVVLFVDTLHLSTSSFMAAKQQLKRFVDEQMTDQDTVAVVTTAVSLGGLQRFTKDRNLLRMALDKMSFRGGTRSAFTPYLASSVLQEDPRAIKLAIQVVIAEEGYVPVNDAVDKAYVMQRASLILAGDANTRRATLSTLREICGRLADLPGQRIVAVVSDGFATLDEGGKTETLDTSAVTGRASLHGVVLYSFGAEGLATPAETQATSRLTGSDIMTFMADSDLDRQQVMRTLAAETGGEVFLHTNNMNKSLQAMLDNNQVYYSLAYYPPDDKNPKKTRSIAVRVKDHPEYTVRAQKGYLPDDRKPEDAAMTPQQRLFQAMISPVPSTAIGVASSAYFLERESDDAQVTVSVHIDGSTLQYQRQEQNYLVHCEVAGSIFDRDGKLIDSFAETVQATFTAQELERAKARGYRYSRRLSFKPGLYDVRIGVREAGSELIGTAASSIEVPDVSAGKPVLSSVFLTETEQEAPPIEIVSARIAPGTPRFKKGDATSYRFVIYNMDPAADSDATVCTDVVQGEKVIRTSQVRLADVEMPRNGSGVEAGGALEPGLARGSYTLRVTIKDAKLKEMARQMVDFEVGP
jgi:VWFA-related protein